jgi:YD repeat-containing protein
VTQETGPDGNTTDYDYDADGNQTEFTDPLGNLTKTHYDADDRVTSVTRGYRTRSISTTSNPAFDGPAHMTLVNSSAWMLQEIPLGLA